MSKHTEREVNNTEGFKMITEMDLEELKDQSFEVGKLYEAIGWNDALTDKYIRELEKLEKFYNELVKDLK